MKDLFQHFNSKEGQTLLLFSHRNLFAIREMKCGLFLYAESDSTKAEQLKDHLQGKLQWMADLKNVRDILAEDQKLKVELLRSDCVVLIGSSQASSLIHNKRTETEDGFETFDGKLFHKEFTENKDLLERLIIVFFTKRTKKDWVPADFDERRLFQLKDGKIRQGNPAMDHIQYCVKELLIGKVEASFD